MSRMVLFFIALATFGSPAFAYVDPGSGMLAIQGMVAVFIGVLAFIRQPVQMVKRLWTRMQSKTRHDA